jgi:hypothetical protein
MTIEDLWDFCGRSWTVVVKDFDTSWGSLRNWRIRGYIPYKHQKKFEHLSKGVLKASYEDSEFPYKKINQLSGADVERTKREVVQSDSD